MIPRKPIRRARLGPPRRGREPDEAYLAWLRKMPCVVCSRVTRSRSPWPRVEAAHVGLRGLGMRCPDKEAIPLCVWHHTMGPESHHVLGRKFWDFWGLDRWDLIAEFSLKYEKERAA